MASSVPPVKSVSVWADAKPVQVAIYPLLTGGDDGTEGGESASVAWRHVEVHVAVLYGHRLALQPLMLGPARHSHGAAELQPGFAQSGTGSTQDASYTSRPVPPMAPWFAQFRLSVAASQPSPSVNRVDGPKAWS